MSGQKVGGYAPFIVRLPLSLVERIRCEALDDPTSPYKDLSDFMVVAAENLLVLNGADLGELSQSSALLGPSQTLNGDPHRNRTAASDTYASRSEPVADSHRQSRIPTVPRNVPGGPLFVLTNRLSPMAYG